MADPIDAIYCLNCRALVDRSAIRCPVCGQSPRLRAKPEEAPPPSPPAPQMQLDPSAIPIIGQRFATPAQILPFDVEKQVSRIVWDEIAHWSEAKRASFVHEYRRQRKSLLIAYLCFLAGLHYLYLGQTGMWLAYFLTGGGCSVWALVDLFRVPGLIQRYNEDRQMALVAWLRGRPE